MSYQLHGVIRREPRVDAAELLPLCWTSMLHCSVHFGDLTHRTPMLAALRNCQGILSRLQANSRPDARLERRICGVDAGTLPYRHCSAGSAPKQHFSFKGDLANSPLLIAMPPYRQSARMGASKSRGLTFTGGQSIIGAVVLIVRSRSPSVLLVLCYFSHFTSKFQFIAMPPYRQVPMHA